MRRPMDGDAMKVNGIVHTVTLSNYINGRWWFAVACMENFEGFYNLEMSGVRKTVELINCVGCLASLPNGDVGL